MASVYDNIQDKQRIIQEFVPGKQVTMAHLIANPEPDLYKKLGVVGERTGALGILTITPGEGAIVNGSVVINGDVASVEAALKDVLDVLGNVMGFTPAPITRT